jgi:predicted SAM-dependent methyltransferase
MNVNFKNPLLLNIGCGRTFHRDWLNLDLESSTPEVRRCDLRKGIPLPNSTCQAIYSSHVFEHLNWNSGLVLLRECYRVLADGGVVRIVVPDLEKIARDYVACMDRGAEIDPFLHEWLLLELYDQTTRVRSGGEMRRKILDANLLEYSIIEKRMGDEARRIRTHGSEINKLRFPFVLSKVIRKVHLFILETVTLCVGGKEARNCLRDGRFRRSGEIHLQMYDRFNLTKALKLVGFVDVKVCSHNESAIPDFSSYCLDTQKGAARKPDSLYLEARK